MCPNDFNSMVLYLDGPGGLGARRQTNIAVDIKLKISRGFHSYICGGFLKWGYPQIIHFCLGFSTFLTIQLLGQPHFRKPPYEFTGLQ